MKNLLLALLLMSAITSGAQNKDSLLSVMAKDACAGIAAKDFSQVSNEDLELELGMAMMPIFGKYADELSSVFNVDLTDQASVTKFGEQLGLQLAIDCPSFMQVISKRAGNVRKPSVPAEEGMVKGKLLRVVPSELTHFIIKDSRGKEEKIWWLEYFTGAELLTDKKNINGEVSVKYYEKEVYNASLKEYIKIKVASGISK